MKLMLILPRVPSPLDKGDKLRAYHMIKNLSEKHELYLYCISENEVPFDIREHLLQYCDELVVFKKGKIKSVLSAVKYTFSHVPFQCGYYYHSDISNEISKAVQIIKPDALLFQLIRTALYAQKIDHSNMVLDYMDAFSSGYERMSQKSSFPEKQFFSNEADRLKEFEKEVYTCFKKHIVISEKDRQLIGGGFNNNARVIHNGVDIDFFKPTKHAVRFDLHFHGNMNYLPNVDCAEFIAGKILPALGKRGIKLTLLISGASPHKRVKALHNNRNITITGWIDDVRAAYAASKIFIAPLQLGTGMQNKVLEAMAMGKPCVVSEMAASALGINHLEQAMVGNTVDEYCDYIIELLHNEKLSTELGNRARKYTEENFLWTDSIHKLESYVFN